MTDTKTSALNKSAIQDLRNYMSGVGLTLSTASGLSGQISNSTDVINALLDMAEENLEQTKEIERLEEALRELLMQASIIHTVGHDATNMQFISLGNKIHLAKEVLK